MNVDPYLTPHTKINSTEIRGLNLRAKAIQLLEEKQQEIFMAFSQAKVSRYNTKSMKEKIW